MSKTDQLVATPIIPHVARGLITLSSVGCLIVLLSAMIILAGYISGRTDLTSLASGQAAVQSGTAVFLVFLTAACLLVYRGRNKTLVVAGHALAGIACLCALATLVEDVSGADFGLNHTWWSLSDDSSGLTFPGPTSPTLCITYALLGLAFLLPRRLADRFQLDRLLLMLVVLLAAFPFVSISCGIPVICDIRSCVRVAPLTAALCTGFGLSALLAKADSGWISILSLDSVAGTMARALAALLACVPPLLVLRSWGVSGQLFNEPIGWWVFSIVLLLLAGSLVAFVSRKLMREADANRKLFEEKLLLATSAVQKVDTPTGTVSMRLKSVCLQCGRDFPSSQETVCPFDQSPLTKIVDDDIVGTIFDQKYRIQAKLGAGGMSTVFKANHQLLGSTVAIKILQTHLQSDKGAIRRFQQEAKAMSGLTHPNLIGIRDFGVTAGGQAFIVMDFIDGVSVSDLIAGVNKTDIDCWLQLFSQICDGLICAHENGIVHRDLKPSNIMLIGTAPYVAKIVDFGLAKIQASDLKLTATGEIAGSPVYMSPEQCAGVTQDARSDIYSLGCVFYECLNGSPPFEASNVYSLLRMHAAEPPRPFRSDVVVPAWLSDLIMQMLAKLPEERPQTVVEIKERLSFAAKSCEHI